MRSDPTAVFDRSIQLIENLFNAHPVLDPTTCHFSCEVLRYFTGIYPGSCSIAERLAQRKRLLRIINLFQTLKLAPLLGQSNPARAILNIPLEQIHLLFIERNNKEAQQKNFAWDSFSAEPEYAMRCYVAYFFLLVVLYYCYKNEAHLNREEFFENNGFKIGYIINALCSTGQIEAQKTISSRHLLLDATASDHVAVHRPSHCNEMLFANYADIGVICNDALIGSVVAYQKNLATHFTRDYSGEPYKIQAYKNQSLLQFVRTQRSFNDFLVYMSTAFGHFGHDMDQCENNIVNKYETIIKFISFLDYVHAFKDGNFRTHDFCLQFFLCVLYKLEPLLVFDPAFLSFGTRDIHNQILVEGSHAFKKYMVHQQPISGKFLLKSEPASQPIGSYDNPFPHGVAAAAQTDRFGAAGLRANSAEFRERISAVQRRIRRAQHFQRAFDAEDSQSGIVRVNPQVQSGSIGSVVTVTRRFFVGPPSTRNVNPIAKYVSQKKFVAGMDEEAFY